MHYVLCIIIIINVNYLIHYISDSMYYTHYLYQGLNISYIIPLALELYAKLAIHHSQNTPCCTLTPFVIYHGITIY